MLITTNLPHVFSLESSRIENAEILEIMLEMLIKINISFLNHHDALSLYRSGVRYGRTSLWEPIPALYNRGIGDCKSLSAALIAEYTLLGIPAKPVFRFSPNSYKGDDHLLFHILVETINGFEDPSRKLGMGNNEWKYFK